MAKNKSGHKKDQKHENDAVQFVLDSDAFYDYSVGTLSRMPKRWLPFILTPVFDAVNGVSNNVQLADGVYMNDAKRDKEKAIESYESRIHYLYEALRWFRVFDRKFACLMNNIDFMVNEKKYMKRIILQEAQKQGMVLDGDAVDDGVISSKRNVKNARRSIDISDDAQACPFELDETDRKFIETEEKDHVGKNENDGGIAEQAGEHPVNVVSLELVGGIDGFELVSVSGETRHKLKFTKRQRDHWIALENEAKKSIRDRVKKDNSQLKRIKESIV